jgi:regulation of enolase protein 1 (concanavalin A-like superfamily)/uncharacterized coiled-coil protein SlyX
MAPAGVISAGGANVISAGGANVVSAGGNNVISAGGANMAGARAGGFRTLGLTEKPLVGAEVFLADAKGAPLPGNLKAVTDAQGNFRIAKVPVGFTLVVATRVKTAEGKDAVLKTLVGTAAAGAKADLSAASTLLAQSLIERSGDKLGHFDGAAFTRAVSAAAAKMTDDALPDLSDLAAMRAYMGELEAAMAELKDMLSAMSQDLARVEQKVEDLQAQLDNLARQSPAPVVLPSVAIPPGTIPGVLPPPGAQPGDTTTPPGTVAEPNTGTGTTGFASFQFDDPGEDTTLNRDETSAQLTAGAGNSLAPGVAFTAPRLTTPRTGDFSITVRLQATLPAAGTAAGLVVTAGDQSILRFERTNTGTAVSVTINGAPVTLTGATRAFSSPDCYLRLTRQGNEFITAYRGAGGSTWFPAASGNFAFPAKVDVGVTAVCTGGPGDLASANFSELTLDGRP